MTVGRWADCPREVYGPKKTLYNRFVRWAERGIWEEIFCALAGAEDAPDRLSIDSTWIKVRRRTGGGKGGRNTKLHAVCDGKGRPLVLLLTPGNVHDCKPARRCIEAMRPAKELVTQQQDIAGLVGRTRNHGGHPAAQKPLAPIRL